MGAAALQRFGGAHACEPALGPKSGLAFSNNRKQSEEISQVLLLQSGVWSAHTDSDPASWIEETVDHVELSLQSHIRFDLRSLEPKYATSVLCCTASAYR